ncbi:MAG: IclR family transcriptional regulator [Rhodobacter sp.]|nr:IclR family transcriptional regulator [Rhodobacter sp.]
MTGDAKPPRLDSTLSKGLSILEALTAAPGSMGVSELSRALGLTKSNTFRLLQTLSILGYVRRDPDKTYRATLKTWQIGRTVVENMNLRSVAAPMMRYLSQETKETVYLAVRDGLSVVYIDKIESAKPIRSWNPIGGTAPLFCVGTGKALLAEDYAQLRETVAPTLKAFTDRTITDIADLDKDMAETRLRGYAVDTGEYRTNIYSLGAAVTLPGGEPAGALGISVPDVHLDDGDVARFGALVQHAARSVTETLSRF